MENDKLPSELFAFIVFLVVGTGLVLVVNFFRMPWDAWLSERMTPSIAIIDGAIMWSALGLASIVRNMRMMVRVLLFVVSFLAALLWKGAFQETPWINGALMFLSLAALFISSRVMKKRNRENEVRK